MFNINNEIPKYLTRHAELWRVPHKTIRRWC